MTRFNLNKFKAIEHAVILYKGNYRKSTGVDAILHPYGVMSILGHYGYSDEVQIAGLMHDVIEDSKLNYTYNDLERDYGKNVKQYVEDLSEKDKSLSWAERKIEHIERIKIASLESKVIETADKINNLCGLIDGIKTEGEEIWNNFNASKENIAWYYIEMYKACTFGEDPDTLIFKDLKKLIDQMGFENIAIPPVMPK